MRNACLIAFAAVLPSVLVASPVAGHGVQVSTRYEIEVAPDFSACATVYFEDQQLFVGGQFSAEGVVSTTFGTRIVNEVEPVAYALYPQLSVIGPICLPGASPDPVLGVAAYALDLHGPSGDVLVSVTCTDSQHTKFECLE